MGKTNPLVEAARGWMFLRFLPPPFSRRV